MKHYSAQEARANFSHMLNSSIEDPVFIQKHDKDFAVVLSVKRYSELEELEDRMLSILATEIDNNNDYLTPKESENVLNSILHEKHNPRKASK